VGRWLSIAGMIAGSCFLGLLFYDWIAVVALGHGRYSLVPWRDFANGAAEDLGLTAVYAATVTPRVGMVVSFYSTMARRVCLIMLGLGLAWYEVMCAWVTRQLDTPPDLWGSLVLLFGVPMLVAPWYVRWLKTKVPDS
jgi:hypothetical protein